MLLVLYHLAAVSALHMCYIIIIIIIICVCIILKSYRALKVLSFKWTAFREVALLSISHSQMLTPPPLQHDVCCCTNNGSKREEMNYCGRLQHLDRSPTWLSEVQSRISGILPSQRRAGMVLTC